jgi:hypothetical protein
MNRISAFCILLLVFIGCSQKNDPDKLADLNLYIDAKQKVDSVFISNIAQDREFLIVPFQDTLKINLKDSINDLYNVWLYSGGKQYSGMSNQLWLSGEQIVIKGTFDNGFQIDTLIGSNLHYKNLEFQENYSQLFKDKKSSEEIDTFLLDFTEKNTDNILALQSAQFYLYKNGTNLEKTKRLQEALTDLNPDLKYHTVFNVPQKIEKLLSLKQIDIGKYAYKTVSGEDTKIVLDASKTYLLDLWFVNCPPCIKDHKKFKENLSLLKENNIEFIGLSRDQDQEKWAKFVQEKSYPWKNYRQAAYDGSMTEDLMITVFPTYFLIEGDGTILQSFNAYNDVAAYIMAKSS